MAKKQCKDPKLTYLNDLGFNVIRLPRSGIAPLDVLGRDKGSIERLGKLSQIWTSTEEEPAVRPSQTAGQINGEKTKEIKLSVGLSILSNILKGMGAAIPQVKFAYRKARKVRFSFTNVRTTAVDPFAAGKYLSNGDLDTANPFVSRYFEDEDTEAYIITEVLESNSIGVTALDEGNREVEVDVPAIQDVVGAKVGVSTSSTSNVEVSYQGDSFLAFGFKVFNIAFVDGDWEVEGVPSSGDISFTTQDLSPALFANSPMSVGEVGFF